MGARGRELRVVDVVVEASADIDRDSRIKVSARLAAQPLSGEDCPAGGDQATTGLHVRTQRRGVLRELDGRDAGAADDDGVVLLQLLQRIRLRRRN